MHPGSWPPHVYDESHHLPGGPDSFTHAHPKEGIGIDPDHSGVSLFTALFEHQPARFEFSAADMKIVIVLPRYSFTLALKLHMVRTQVSQSRKVPEIGHRATLLLKDAHGVVTYAQSRHQVSPLPLGTFETLSCTLRPRYKSCRVSLTSSHVTLHNHQAPRPVSPVSTYPPLKICK